MKMIKILGGAIDKDKNFELIKWLNEKKWMKKCMNEWKYDKNRKFFFTFFISGDFWS